MIRILVLDDEAESLYLYKMIFEQKGHEVTCVETPSAALEAIQTKKIDVIISDYSLPQMTGLEFLDTVKQKHLYEGKFVFVTGSHLDILQTLKVEGVNKVFEKPISFKSLSSYVEQLAS